MSVFPASYGPHAWPRSGTTAKPAEREGDSAASAWLERMRLRHPIHFVVERNGRDRT